MAYMMMLTLGNPGNLDGVLEAWHKAGVVHVTFIDSTCSGEGTCQPRHHIPIRFAFENLGPSTEQCSCTLFAIAQDEATVQACIASAEAVVGSLDQASGTTLVAWLLPIVKGIPGSQQNTGEA